MSSTARELVQQALHLCQYGERAPGAPADPAAETWREWAKRAEEWLRQEQIDYETWARAQPTSEERFMTRVSLSVAQHGLPPDIPRDRWLEILRRRRRITSLETALVAEHSGVSVEWLLYGGQP